MSSEYRWYRRHPSSVGRVGKADVVVDDSAGVNVDCHGPTTPLNPVDSVGPDFSTGFADDTGQ